jgi:perosamine synthetase
MECLDTGWISSEGPFIKKFEEAMAKAAGRKYGVAVANGSVALDAAMEALSLKKGDAIIMPSFTIISCAAAVVRAGLHPIFVDCDEHTFNMNIDHVKAVYNKGVKAIMLVHLYGLPVDVDPILDFAKQNGLKIIEDAAEMHGQTYKGRLCGSFGDVSIFSFYPNKHVTTGEGGMIVTDSQEIFEKSQSLRNLCFVPERRFIHYELGYNFRMTNMQAALGLAQVENLPKHVELKRKMGNYYNNSLKNIKKAVLPVPKTSYAENIYWVYPLVLKKESGMNAATAMKLLAERGVGTRPFFYPMHAQPIMKKLGFGGEKCPVSEFIAENGFYIPSGLGLTEAEMEHVSKQVLEVLG